MIDHHLSFVCLGGLKTTFSPLVLFLLPKGGTMLPLDHRPISVTNADNRLIAKALVRAITPAVQEIVCDKQRGFVPGRTADDNIQDLLTRLLLWAE